MARLPLPLPGPRRRVGPPLILRGGAPRFRIRARTAIILDRGGGRRPGKRQTTRGGLDDPFFDRGAEVLRHRAAEYLIYPLKSTAAFERFEDTFAVAKLPASARLFLVSALDLCRRGDRFLVRHLWRVERDLYVVAVGKFFHNGLDVKLAAA